MLNMNVTPLAIELLTACAFLVVNSGHADAQETPQDTLKVGDTAPEFRIPSTVPVPPDGSTVSVSALTGQGKTVVIAFFPKAFTGG